MNDDRDAIERLIASVADDTPADWEREFSTLTPSDSQQFESLRDLSRIADFNRALQRGAGALAEPARGEWGGLQLLERLSGGARAEVWRAWDPVVRRDVALKLVRANGAGAALAADALLAEARAAARVSHPHVVVVHGVARHGDRVGLWMEFVRGRSLDDLVRHDGPLAPADVAALGAQLASALAAVHRAGVVHRDVKPANVLRDAAGRWVLADFGLGVSPDRSDAAAFVTSGTPMYMAPESFRGEPANAASDQYGLGLLLWFALAGRDPFVAKTVEERAAQAERGPATKLAAARPGIPASLAAIVERAIAADPAARYASAGEFARALEGWTPARTNRSAPWLVGAIAAALVATVAFVAWRATSKPAATTPPVPAVAAPPAPAAYSVAAAFTRRNDGGSERLQDGARVRPGDRLSLELEVSRPAYAYVLNEDERGERYLLFPQPAFDRANPLPANAAITLPGTIGGRENAWRVTSAGGREHFLVVVSPEPIADLEAEIAKLPAPRAGRPIAYAPVGEATMERLRGVGGLTALPSAPAPAAPRTATAFDRFSALAERESGVSGVWVRKVVFENPGR